MASIGSLGTPLKLPIGQVPQIKVPALNNEFQEIYNSIHILNGYLEALRAEFEGTDSGTPAENLPFRRRIRATAKQAIEAGSVVSFFTTGVVKGVNCSSVPSSFNSSPSFNYAAPGFSIGPIAPPGIALTTAAIGEEIEVGLVPGVIKLVGAKCGQTLWASNSRWCTYRRGQTNDTVPLGQRVAQALVGDGSLYLANPQYIEGGVPWRGIPQPGYPYRDGDWKYCGIRYLIGVGVCIADDYVMMREYVLADNLA